MTAGYQREADNKVLARLIQSKKGGNMLLQSKFLKPSQLSGIKKETTSAEFQGGQEASSKQRPFTWIRKPLPPPAFHKAL
jgi:hypothetical protein